MALQWWKKEYQVKPNTQGFLYRNNQFEKRLSPGIYRIWDLRHETELVCLPETSKMFNVLNQEVLTKDNIALRFSFTIIYRIVDGLSLLSKFPLDRPANYIVYDAEQRLQHIFQVLIRNFIVQLDSEALNDKRGQLLDFKSEETEGQSLEFGISIESATLRDITFPKSIQDLFAKHLEAKIRAKSDLENARTTVATARALKNAADLMKDDDNMKFIQMLETINKIAEKGKHTFMIGDWQQLSKK